MKTKGIYVRNVHTCQISGKRYYQVLISYGACARVKKIWID